MSTSTPGRGRTSLASRLYANLRTIGSLIAFFSRRERFFLAPLLIVLLLASLLLLLTSGLSYVAPFVYALF